MPKKLIDLLVVFSLFLLAACSGQSSEPTNAVSPQGSPTAAVLQTTETQPAELESPTQAGTTQTAASPTEAPIADTGSISCTAPAALTPASTEGPYYTPGSPERTSLVEQLPGTRLILTGYVLDASCQPVPGAWLDFWQADSQGVYDNSGYTLRGHQYTDEEGRYRLETVVPGVYPGRTEHIHVKVQAPDGPELTTQLYFPNSGANEGDRIYSPELLIEIVSEEADSLQATFNFIIETE